MRYLEFITTFNVSKLAPEKKKIYTAKKQRFKITHLGKVQFIKANELKLTQIKLFNFFHFMCVAANGSE